ncbi:MAG TPA: Crp/Fnr family transcriptional regulator [Noviherbaspirillum sp.]|nr:Crp/Fnr family transcriptional regulator [Noviherbaspirillum sp.]
MRGTPIENWDDLARTHPQLALVPGALRDAATEILLGKSDTLCSIGDRPLYMLCVLEGELRLIRRTENGASIVLQRATRGFIAEASLEAPRYHCEIVAAENTRVLRLPIDGFRRALRDDEAFRNAWMTRLMREVRQLRAQCERLSLHSAAERIEHYIEAEGNNGRFELRQSKKAWAAELALSHEALYRTLTGMERDGRIRIEREGDLLVLSIFTRPH